MRPPHLHTLLVLFAIHFQCAHWFLVLSTGEEEGKLTAPPSTNFINETISYIGMASFLSNKIVLAFSGGQGYMIELSINSMTSEVLISGRGKFSASAVRQCTLRALSDSTFAVAWADETHGMRGRYLVGNLPLSEVPLEDWAAKEKKFDDTGEILHLDLISLDNNNEDDGEDESPDDDEKFFLMAYSFKGPDTGDRMGRFVTGSSVRAPSDPISFWPTPIFSVAIAFSNGIIYAVFSSIDDDYKALMRACEWSPDAFDTITCPDEAIAFAQQASSNELSIAPYGATGRHFVITAMDYDERKPHALLGIYYDDLKKMDILDDVTLSEYQSADVRLQKLGTSHSVVVFTEMNEGPWGNYRGVVRYLSAIDDTLIVGNANSTIRKIFADFEAAHTITSQLDEYSFGVAFRRVQGSLYTGELVILGTGFYIQPQFNGATDVEVYLSASLRGAQKVTCLNGSPPPLDEIPEEAWRYVGARVAFDYTITGLTQNTTYTIYCVTDDGIVSDPPLTGTTPMACVAPQEGMILFQGSPACEPEIISWGRNCTTKCLNDMIPSEPILECYAGSGEGYLWPPSFLCVDKTDPIIVSQTPAHNATLHHPKDVILLKFNEPVQRLGSVKLTTDDNPLIQAAVEWGVSEFDNTTVTFNFSKLSAATKYTLNIPEGTIGDVYDLLPIWPGENVTRGDERGARPNYLRQTNVYFKVYPNEICDNQIDDDDDGKSDCDDEGCKYSIACLSVCDGCNMNGCGPKGVETVNVSYSIGAEAANELPFGAQGTVPILATPNENSYAASQGLHANFELDDINGAGRPLGNLRKKLLETNGPVDLRFTYELASNCELSKCLDQADCQCLPPRLVGLKCPMVIVTFSVPNIEYEMLYPDPATTTEGSEEWGKAVRASEAVDAAITNELATISQVGHSELGITIPMVLVTMKPGSVQVLVCIVYDGTDHMEEVHARLAAVDDMNSRLALRVKDALVPEYGELDVQAVGFKATPSDIYPPTLNLSSLPIVLGSGAPLYLPWDEDVEVMIDEPVIRVSWPDPPEDISVVENEDIIEALNGTTTMHSSVGLLKQGHVLVTNDRLRVLMEPLLRRSLAEGDPANTLVFRRNSPELPLVDDGLPSTDRKSAFCAILPELPEGHPPIDIQIPAGLAMDRFGNYNEQIDASFRIGTRCQTPCGMIEHEQTCAVDCPPLSTSIPDPGKCLDGLFIQECYLDCLESDLDDALDVLHYAPFNGSLPASNVGHNFKHPVFCDSEYLFSVTWLAEIQGREAECNNGTWDMPLCGPEDCQPFSLPDTDTSVNTTEHLTLKGTGLGPLSVRTVSCAEDTILTAGEQEVKKPDARLNVRQVNSYDWTPWGKGFDRKRRTREEKEEKEDWAWNPPKPAWDHDIPHGFNASNVDMDLQDL